MLKKDSTRVVGLPERSILYLSVTIAADHPCYPIFRSRIDVGPERDLGRILDSSGGWVRRYVRRVVVASRDDLRLRDSLLDGVRGIISGGSFHSWVGDDQPLSFWQRQTLEFVRDAVFERDVPYLGLCGGGQVGLLALGGSVEPNPRRIGLDGVIVRTENLQLTQQGKCDPIFLGCPEQFRIQAIHSDHFARLPTGALALAEVDDFHHRVVGFDKHVRLFQPHPELSHAYARRLLEALEERLVPPHLRGRLREAIAALEPAPEANSRVVRNFLQHICADSDSTST